MKGTKRYSIDGIHSVVSPDTPKYGYKEVSGKDGRQSGCSRTEGLAICKNLTLDNNIRYGMFIFRSPCGLCCCRLSDQARDRLYRHNVDPIDAVLMSLFIEEDISENL